MSNTVNALFVCVYYVAINIIVNVSLLDMIQILTDFFFLMQKESYFYETVPFQVFCMLNRAKQEYV